MNLDGARTSPNVLSFASAFGPSKRFSAGEDARHLGERAR